MSDESSQPIATFNFIDPDAEDKLFVGVSLVRNGLIGLAVSLEQDGDYYIFFGPNEAALLIGALQKARDEVLHTQSAVVQNAISPRQDDAPGRSWKGTMHQIMDHLREAHSYVTRLPDDGGGPEADRYRAAEETLREGTLRLWALATGLFSGTIEDEWREEEEPGEHGNQG